MEGFHPEKKLYDFTDIRGDKHEKVFNVYRGLDEEFSQYESYIGMFPVGSVALGYSEQYSDYDVVILFDETKSDYGEARGSVKPYAKSLHKEKGVELHTQQDMLNINEVLNAFASRDIEHIAHNMKTLSYLGKGARIEEYRSVIRTSYQALETEIQDKVRATFVDLVVDQIDQFSGHKVSSRQYGNRSLNEQEAESLKKQGDELRSAWENRFDIVWA